jgi:hypothetical protein
VAISVHGPFFLRQETGTAFSKNARSVLAVSSKGLFASSLSEDLAHSLEAQGGVVILYFARRNRIEVESMLTPQSLTYGGVVLPLNLLGHLRKNP